jgi:hypothetical protein
MEEAAQTVALSRQLIWAAAMMLACTLVHAFGLIAISKSLGLGDDRLEDMRFGWKGAMVTAGLALLLFLLHTAEIGLFAAFYLVIGVMETLEEALYYSASAYATLGRTAEYFPVGWRLIGAIEALIGFLMIGWSTAFMVSKAGRIMPH